MLTSLYYAIPILKSLFSGFCASLPGGYHSRSLLMGILGRWAGRDEMTITAIAKLFGVSRQAVYGNIHRIAELEAKFQMLPETPAHCIMITPENIDKAILSLALDAHAPLEGIQRVLTCIYGREASRSIGYISELLTKAGAFAREITKTLSLQGIHQGANDELFDAGDHPVLTGVDVESTYIYLMLDMNDRKGETWELAMETLKDLGLNLKVAISDAGSGLLKGTRAAFPDADVQMDVFHVLRDIGRSVHQFKAHVLAAVADCYDLEAAVARCKNPWQPKAKRKKRKLADCMAKIPVMVEDYDTLSCLYSWVHELISFSGYTYREVMGLMDWILDEMAALAGRNRWAYKLSNEISRFRERLPVTLLFLDRLFLDFRRAAKTMGLPDEAFHLLYRRLSVAKDSEAYMELTRQAFNIIGQSRFTSAEKVHDRLVGCIKMASSLVENVNSRLRAYMNIKRHVSSNFYSLVQLHMNTKKYRRSRIASRKGRSPVEILTGESWPEIITLFEERGFWDKCKTKKIA